MATVTTKRGKKPRPPGHVKVYKTAVFKIHNPSQHKRAMLKDSMKRAHLAYTRLLAHFLPDIERLGGMNSSTTSRVSRRDRRFSGRLRSTRSLPPLEGDNSVRILPIHDITHPGVAW